MKKRTTTMEMKQTMMTNGSVTLQIQRMKMGKKKKESLDLSCMLLSLSTTSSKKLVKWFTTTT